MAKVPFQDVTPPEKRSIRNVPIPAGKKRTPIVIRPEVKPAAKSSTEKKVVSTPKPEVISKDPSEVDAINEKRKQEAYEYYYPKKEQREESEIFQKDVNKRKYVFIGAALVVVALFVVGMMTVFASAKIEITPRTQGVEINMDIPASSEATQGSVRYEVVKLTKSDTVSVPAKDEEEVETKAEGKIMVYNNFSTEPQRLIVRTRFQSSDGLIYRIPESIVIPGKTVKNGVETPGSIETKIVADETGEKYNTKKTDFSIPGFKNDAARYKGFYARSTTDITGGFIGKRKAVSAEDKDAAMQEIETETEDLLEKEIRSQIGEGLTLLGSAVLFESTELPQQNDSSSAILGKEVTAYAIILNSEDLAQKIVGEYIKDYAAWANIPATIKDFNNLSVQKKPDLNAVKSGNSISLQVAGQVKIVGKIDEGEIKENLAGNPRSSAGSLLDQYPGISGVKATIRPIWKRSFPQSTSKIDVSVLY